MHFFLPLLSEKKGVKHHLNNCHGYINTETSCEQTGIKQWPRRLTSVQHKLLSNCVTMKIYFEGHCDKRGRPTFLSYTQGH